MGRRGRGLASRFKKAHEKNQDETRRADEDERRRRARQAEARNDLFEDLAAFAEETGFLKSRLRDGVLTLRYEKRELRFSPVGEADEVEVTWENLPENRRYRLYLEGELERWVLAVSRRRREDRILLWDDGVEALMVDGLGLPVPEGEDFEPEQEDPKRSDRRRKL